ncbi:MAG: hypothetical protein KKG60_00630, partial [Nanoarchaeota archaeon]|nr:hypothetical protein [Nanoarchaeota archaeon]
MINGKRGVLLVIISLLFFLLVIKESSGVGILGNQLDVMLEFEPGLEREFSYGVVVTNGEVDQYEAFVVEELAKYMWVEPRYLIFDKTRGGTPSFRAVLKLPNSESELGAGKHCAGVGVTEMFPESVEGEGIKIMARTSAKARVCVRVLYDGKYIEAKLHAPNINENTLFIPEITVSSWGKEDISSVYADVFIQ